MAVANVLFPAQGVLGYSDAGFLNALPYITLRFMGIDPFTSYQIVLFALVAVGWIGTILFFRCCLKVSLFPAIVGAVLFVFPNAIATSVGHTQLLTIFFIPYLAAGIYVFLKNFAKVTFTGTFAGIFVSLMFPAIFYTSFYIGWFLAFFVLLWFCVCCAWSALHSGVKAALERSYLEAGKLVENIAVWCVQCDLLHPVFTDLYPHLETVWRSKLSSGFYHVTIVY